MLLARHTILCIAGLMEDIPLFPYCGGTHIRCGEARYCAEPKRFCTGTLTWSMYRRARDALQKRISSLPMSTLEGVLVPKGLDLRYLLPGNFELSSRVVVELPRVITVYKLLDYI